MIGLTCVIAAIVLFVMHNANAYGLLLSASTAGFFFSYAMSVVGAAIQRLRGKWTPGVVSMGKYSGPVTFFAAIWMIAETVNIAWPRNIYGSWFLNWGIVLAAAVLGVLGFAVSSYVFRPGGDAAGVDLTPVLADSES